MDVSEQLKTAAALMVSELPRERILVLESIAEKAYEIIVAEATKNKIAPMELIVITYALKDNLVLAIQAGIKINAKALFDERVKAEAEKSEQKKKGKK